MKGRRTYLDYLADIVEAANKALHFIQGMDFARFEADDKTVYAVIRALEVIGEATKNIPRSEQQKYPRVPWRRMAAMRDKLIHGYFGVNLRRVFDTVREELPPIRDAVESILSDRSSTVSRSSERAGAW